MISTAETSGTMIANKRRKLDDSRDNRNLSMRQDSEPPVDVNISANTATVLLDTKRNNITPPYLTKGVLPDNEVIVAGSVVESRGISYDVVGKNSANIISSINAMTGCQRFRYFGDFSTGPDYGFHTGNSLIVVRFVVAKIASGDERIIDIFVKIPTGLSFMTEDADAESTRLREYIDVLFAGPYWFESRNVYYNDSDAFEIPGKGTWYSDGIFRCKLTGDKRLIFYIDQTKLIDDYKADFRILDHPNAITSRGAGISGAGVLSTATSSQGAAVFYAYDDSVFPPLTYSDLAIQASDFTDLHEGIITNPLEFIIAVKNTKIVTHAYICQRPPALLDARYYIINIPEATFDSKTGIITNQLFISFETVGVQMMDFLNKRNRELDEDQGLDFVFTNPMTNLSPNCSTMSLQVSRMNDFGEDTFPGLVSFASPGVDQVTLWVPTEFAPEEAVINLLSSNILKNVRGRLDGAAIPSLTTVDTEYVDNKVRVNPSENFVHFGLAYMV